MLTTSVIGRPALNRPPRTASAKSSIRASVSSTPGITSAPSTSTGSPARLRKAVCKTARPSVSLICRPANIASRLRGNLWLSARSISAARASASISRLGIIKQHPVMRDRKRRRAFGSCANSAAISCLAGSPANRLQSVQHPCPFMRPNAPSHVLQHRAHRRLFTAAGSARGPARCALPSPVITMMLRHRRVQHPRRQRDARLGQAGRAHRHQHRRILAPAPAQGCRPWERSRPCACPRPSPATEPRSAAAGRCWIPARPGRLGGSRPSHKAAGNCAAAARPASSALADQPRVRARMHLRHPALVAQHHIDPRPIEVRLAQRVKDRPRRRAPRHHAQRRRSSCTSDARNSPASVLARSMVSISSVGIFEQFHGFISRQRRPSRCISISASSGPALPES